MSMKPPIIFSILHTSARPDQWKKVYDAWIGMAKHPEMVEYVLVIDPRWGFCPSCTNCDGGRANLLPECPQCGLQYDPERITPVTVSHGDLPKVYGMREQDQVIVNTGRKCYVEGVNLAAAASCGQLLIVNADDQYPCQDWDEQLGGMSTAGIRTPIDEFVVEVNTGTPKEHDRCIMVMPILSRARYRKLGYVLYPEYESMYADNDFYTQAFHDGCIIDCRHLPVFPHKHPFFDPSVEMDDAYKAQNRLEAYSLGKALFEGRLETGFDNHVVAVENSTPARRKVIACCLPGEHFSSVWLSNWTSLFGHMQNRYTVAVTFGYSSSVYVTRATMAHHLISTGAEFDYVLWLDDDNVLTPEHFELLKEDLDRNPELDAVVGWCWVQTDWYSIEGAVSCGLLSESGMSRNLTHEELMSGNEPLVEIGWSGFPCVLMRGLKSLKAAGKHPFQALTEDQYSWGMAGEDVSFFVRAGRAGCKFAVDRRVEVPHFKSRAVGPEKEAFRGVQVVHKMEPK